MPWKKLRTRRGFVIDANPRPAIHLRFISPHHTAGGPTPRDGTNARCAPIYAHERPLHLKLAKFALHNDKVIAFLVAVLALLGVRAYLTAPQSIFPTMSFARIDVVADVGQLPPSQVRVGVTRPLEAAFQALPSVTDVVATSSQGTAELFVNFASKTNPQADLQIVEQAISQVRASVPAAKNVAAIVVNPNSEPVLSYALTSKDFSQAVLRNVALAQIVPKLYGIPGLGNLSVAGGPTTEFHVELDPAKLAAQGVSAADVGKTLADTNTVAAVGVAQHFYQRYAIVIDSSLRDRFSLERVAVSTKNGASVPLASLGTVSLGVSPVTAQTSLDAKHSVVINAYGLQGADIVTMAAAVDRRVASLIPSLPHDVLVSKYWDQTMLIVESQKALRDAIMLGALLAIVVIYAFLRSLRLTLVAAAVIPLAMAIAIGALQLAGQTLNLMSVGGLAVAVGLIIDDAIVVIENIARNRRERPELSGDASIELSMAQLTKAMIASTSTTVVVFIPLALLTGVTGFFFRALAFTLSASLIVSLGLALFIAPVIARILLRGSEERAHTGDVIGKFLDRYEPLLRWALGHRLAVALASAGVLAVTILLLARLPSDFLPKMDEGQFEIRYRMPVGTTLEASDAAGTQMERAIATDPAVAIVARLTGIDSNGFTPTQANQGLLRVRLVPTGRPGYDAVSARLRDRLVATVPSARYDFHQILEDLVNDLSGAPSPIEIAVKGNDQTTLIALAQKVATAIADVPGVVDVSNGVVYDNPLLRIAPRGGALSALGLTPGDVGAAIEALGQGTIATSLPGIDALIPVRVRVTSANSAGGGLVDGSTSLYAKGTSTSVGDLAAITPVRLSSDITTKNGQIQIRVTAGMTGANLSAVTAGIAAKLLTVSFPPGYSADIGGQEQTQKQSFAEFLNVIAIAIALVFAVMLATFRSFRLPLVILTAIPLALFGVALGLFVTGTPFNVSSFMGLLLLVGVVVKNGILLIDVANRARAEGASVEEALMVAGKTRLRPIVMTTLAAIGGLIPLAIGLGQGAEMEKPLAIAVIGGLSTATFFTLIVIPVLYAAFSGGTPPVVAATEPGEMLPPRPRATAVATTSLVLALALFIGMTSSVYAQAPPPTGTTASTGAGAPKPAAPAATPDVLATPAPAPSPTSSVGPNTGSSGSPAAPAGGAPPGGVPARGRAPGHAIPPGLGLNAPAIPARPVVFAHLSLVAAETAALVASPDIAVAAARLSQSQYALAAARSGIAPSLVSNYVQVPQGNPPGPNIISRQVTAGIQFTVGDFLAFSSAVREAASTLAATQADATVAEVTERTKVVGLYFDALKARAVASARRDALALATSQKRAARVRASAGDAPQLDVVRADVAVQKSTADLEFALAADGNATAALQSETASANDALDATLPTDFPTLDPKLLDSASLIALARTTRPELLSARRATEAAQAAIRSARALGFPAVVVSGGYLVGTDSGVPINAPTINASLAIPFSSANKNKVGVAAARAVEARAKAAGVERLVTLNVAASARTLGATQRAAAATVRARASAQTQLRSTELGYRNGATTSLELLAARSTYTQAVVDEVSALYDLEKARNILNIEVGR